MHVALIVDPFTAAEEDAPRTDVSAQQPVGIYSYMVVSFAINK